VVFLFLVVKTVKSEFSEVAFSKCYVDVLPFCVYLEEVFRGVLFLDFLSVVIYMGLQGLLSVGVFVGCVLRVLRNLVCKVFVNNVVLSLEPNKKQKVILDLVDNTVGKF